MLILLIRFALVFFSMIQISRWLGIFDQERPFKSWLGAVAVFLLFAHAWALVFPLKFLLIFLSIAALLELYKSGLRSFNTSHKGAFIILLAASIPSVLPVWINDDSAYYIPTIKWLAQFGFSPGLAEWNIRYGLSSSWHMLSAIFYWEGITPDRIWNFNALLLFLFSWEYLNRNRPLIGLIPVLLLSAPFLNAASADLPILLITVYLFLEGESFTAKDWALILTLIIGVKATAAPVLLVGLYPLIRFRTSFIKWLALPGPMMLLWMLKNQMLTGNTLFPIASDWFGTEWALPAVMLKDFANGVLAEIYGLGFAASDWTDANYSLYDRLLGLFQLKPYKVLMNVLIILGSLFLAIKLRTKKVQGWPIWSIWSILALIAWFFLAPNYRFHLGFGIAALVLFLNTFPAWAYRKVILLPILSITFLGMIWMNTQGTSYLRIVPCGTPTELSFQQVMVPVPYPQLETERIETENSYYYRPGDCLYCGDAPVPCLPDTLKATHESYGVTPWWN